jgi:uncharacterized protein (TIRG00374 family)
MSKRNIRILIGISLGAGFAYLSFRNARISDIIRVISEVSLYWILVVLGLTYATLVMRAVRWGILLSPVKKIGLGSLFSSLLIGYMTNNVLPLRIGEAVRAYHIGNKENIPKSTTLGSILLERLLDLWTVMILLLLSAAFFGLSERVNRVLMLGALLSVAMLAVVYLISKKREQLSELVRKLLTIFLPKYAEKGGRIVHAFAEGAGLVRTKRRLALLLLTSVTIWIMGSAIVYCVSTALSIHIPVWGAPVVVCLIALGITIPTAPGDIGAFQFFSMLGLSVFGIEKDRALAFSLVLHASQYVPQTLTGLVLIWRESISLAGLRRASWKEQKRSQAE